MELLGERSSSSGQDSKSSEALVFPTRPEAAPMSQQIKLLSNFYKLNCDTGGRNVIFEYQVKTEPYLSCHSGEEKLKFQAIIKQTREKLTMLLGNFTQWEDCLYTFELVDVTELDKLLTEEIDVDNVKYRINLEPPRDYTFDDPK